MVFSQLAFHQHYSHTLDAEREAERGRKREWESIYINSNLYCSTYCESVCLDQDTERKNKFIQSTDLFFRVMAFLSREYAHWRLYIYTHIIIRAHWANIERTDEWCSHFFYYSLSEVLNWRWRWVDGFTMALEYSKGINVNELISIRVVCIGVLYLWVFRSSFCFFKWAVIYFPFIFVARYFHFCRAFSIIFVSSFHCYVSHFKALIFHHRKPTFHLNVHQFSILFDAYDILFYNLFLQIVSGVFVRSLNLILIRWIYRPFYRGTHTHTNNEHDGWQ